MVFVNKQFNDKNGKHSEAIPKQGRLSDFNVTQTIGRGSFSTVVQAKHAVSGKYYAIKMMSKQLIFEKKRIDKVLNEKAIMSSIRFEFLTQLEYFFHDGRYLYFAMHYCPGGDMFTHIRRHKKFSELVARFYVAQITLALEYLHAMGLIHRDVKPENVLIDFDGYIKLTDFGFSKRVLGKTYSFCGTAEYIAPEILKGAGYGRAVDWWAMGVMLFELVFGRTPFEKKDRLKMFAVIQAGDYKIPTGRPTSSDLHDLIEALLQTDSTKRIGNLKGGSKDVKDHRFFHGLAWKDLTLKALHAPLKPPMKSISDCSNFDEIQVEPEVITAETDFGNYFSCFN